MGERSALIFKGGAGLYGAILGLTRLLKLLVEALGELLVGEATLAELLKGLLGALSEGAGGARLCLKGAEALLARVELTAEGEA